MLNKVGRGTVFVASIVGGQSRNLATGVSCGPCTKHTVTLVRTSIGNAIEVGLELLVVVNVLSSNTLPEHIEIEVLIAQVNIKTP
ncbi:MAG: DUF1622 domain-containing protein [Prevotella sp.]|nr:DUF1622 domain-containing protein [Prevotella sp.]